jgi:mRNA interferase MazF
VPTSGDVVAVDLGVSAGSEAGLPRPAVVVTADRVLAGQATVVQVAPLTSTLGGYLAEVTVAVDPANGLHTNSAAQCQHIRAVAIVRLGQSLGNVGPAVLSQVCDTLATLAGRDRWRGRKPRRAGSVTDGLKAHFPAADARHRSTRLPAPRIA